MPVSRPSRREITTVLALTVLSGLASFALGGWLFPPTEAQGVTVGGPLPGLSTFETSLYNQGILPFTERWTIGPGLGPVFTNMSCTGCHSNPVGGGDSNKKSKLFGKLNGDGSFNDLADEGGPLLQPNSIAGLIHGNNNCVLPGEHIPADATILSNRKAPNLLGAGLIDAISDTTILANASTEANDSTDQRLGIHGVPNMVADLNGNLRPGRFGYKAAFPTLLQIVAAAFQHDLGITNPINPNEDLPQGNPIPAACQFASTEPNDVVGNHTMNIFQIVEFMAPSTPAALTPAGLAGQQTFLSISCASCHIPSLTTGSNVQVSLTLSASGTVTSAETSAALSNQTVNLYSDLLLHDMGPGLADGFVQGQATGSVWRTTPLWGLSSRNQYLHDGRTNDLTTAITAHGGEAAAVINKFNALSAQDQANLITFLKSL